MQLCEGSVSDPEYSLPFHYQPSPQPFQFISILTSNTAVIAGLGFPLTLRRLPSALNCAELCSKFYFVFYDVDECPLEIGNRNSCLLETAQFKNSTSVKPSLGHMDLLDALWDLFPDLSRYKTGKVAVGGEEKGKSALKRLILLAPKLISSGTSAWNELALFSGVLRQRNSISNGPHGSKLQFIPPRLWKMGGDSSFCQWQSVGLAHCFSRRLHCWGEVWAPRHPCFVFHSAEQDNPRIKGGKNLP